MISQREKIKRKNKIQKTSVDLSKNHRFLCLEWSTGVGKSLAAIKIIENQYKDNNNIKVYIICKENNHKKNWIEEFKKHKKDYLLKNVSIVLYTSMHKEDESADLLIMDECHALTGKRIEKLRQVLSKKTRVVFLSATIPKEKKVLMNSFCRPIKYFPLPLNEAFKLGLLPEPRLFIHHVDLKESKELYNLKLRKSKSFDENGKEKFVYCDYLDRREALKNTKKNIGVIARCNQIEFYFGISDLMDYYVSIAEDYDKPMGLRIGCRNKYLNLASQRKSFLSKVKGEYVKDLVMDFRKNHKRFICFTGSVEQARKIGSVSAIHSKNRKEKNQSIIDCFNRKECSELFAVKMLRESVNLTDIEKGVITQLDSTIGSFYQMLGRALRHDFPEMHIFVIKDTQDEKYLDNSLKDFDKKYITNVYG